jgi:hypothetical protein
VLLNIDSFFLVNSIEDLLRPHVTLPNLDAAYAEMAQDEARQAGALEWAEALVGDATHETW